MSYRHTALMMLALAMGAGAARGGMVITEVDPAGSGAAYGADWFELTNTGTVAVDMTNWKMDDSSNAYATAVAMRMSGAISSATILPGQSIVFAESNTSGSNDGTIQTAFINAWFGGTAPEGFVLNFYGGSGVGLSTGGDGVNLFDAAGAHVAGVSFGTAIAGATFDNVAGLDGVAITTASVAGINGAFSNGAETGSPGAIASVPEPASLSVLALGGMALLRRRRR